MTIDIIINKGAIVINTIQSKIVLAWITYMLMGMAFGWTSLYVQAEENTRQVPTQESLIPITGGFDLGGVQLAEVSLQDIQAAWDVLYEKIAKESGVLAQNKLYYDIDKLMNDFNTHELDFVLTTALNYLRMTSVVELNRDADIYGAVVGGQKTYQYLLLVRADSGISGLEELQRKIMLVKKGDETGNFYVNTVLLKNGQPESDRFFSSISETKNFSQAVLEVFFRKGDACLTTTTVFETMVELNPQVGKQLAIIERSSAFANPVLFFHKLLPPDTKKLITETFLNFETSVYGQQFLLLHKIDRLIQFDPSDLDSLRELLQEYETYKR